ncbi:hypothetical protein [Alteriqipengyuania sp.]|uniref:hypothetical protein n=1 Tax=Alteriqipengyuania sp. TaxID=2800692 RepID=UPI003516F663
MSDNSKTPATGDKPDGENDSELVKEHRGLMNQGSATPEDYPEEERAAQSLVDKGKRRDR